MFGVESGECLGWSQESVWGVVRRVFGVESGECFEFSRESVLSLVG